MPHLAAVMSSFVDELTKIAKKNDQSKDIFDDKVVRGGAALAGTKALQVASGLGTSFLLTGPEEKFEATASRMKEMQKGMGLGKSLPVNEFVGVPRNAYYNPTNQTFAVPRAARDAVMAHEIGHALNAKALGSNTSSAKRLLHMIPYTLSRKLSPMVGASAAAASAMNEDPSYKPALASLAAHSPMLLEEGAASGRALSYLAKKHGLLRGAFKSLPLVPAFMSYGAYAAAPFAVTAYRKHMKKRREAKENS